MDPENTKSKRKAIFLVFLGGFAWFSRKSNEDEFSQKSNGAWIFSEIKRGWIFPEIEWGMDFIGNQRGVAKKKKNNMIRLVPARIESGRVREGLF